MKILILVFTLISTSVFANWNNINSNINDDLTGIVVWGSNGLVSGNQGLYYSNNTSTASPIWTRFNINGNNSDSVVYNNTKFTHCFSVLTNVAYACGEDTVNNRAVIIRFDMATLGYSIIYLGGTNTRLNKLGDGFGNIYAVGDNGLLIQISGSVATPINSGLAGYDLSSFSAFGSTYWYGANGHKIRGTGNPSTLNYTVENVPYNLKDVECVNSSLTHIVGDGYWHWSGSFTEYDYYNYGPLNGNEIYNLGNSNYVGTNHGIFYWNSNFSHNALEWQPTSLTHNIRSFFQDPINSKLYSCGDAGVILSTSNSGGASVPYTSLNLPGGCVNTSLTMQGVTGSSWNCEWFVDGVSEGSNCSGFSHNFTSTGTYEIKLVGYNGPYVDSSIQIIHIVNPPAVNLMTTTLDSTICHIEPFDVMINGSETEVQYRIRRFDNPNTYLNLPIAGNGGAINLTTIPVSYPGPYYIQAESTLANCSTNFTDSIVLTVDKTTAQVHVGAVNASTNENVFYYENCVDATNYQWTFGAGASIGSSNLANPTLNYGTPGTSNTQLLCWSDNGCYDSVTVTSPMIYAPPSTEDFCWTNVTSGLYGNYSSTQRTFTESQNGKLIVTSHDNRTYTSQHGNDLFIPNLGTAIVKYGNDGTIKWFARTHYTGSSLSYGDFKDVQEDSFGNIYLIGDIDNHYFVDNSGDTTDIANSSFILKLNSLGVLQWSRIFPASYFEPTQLAIDYDGNIVIAAGISGPGIQSSFNNGPMETWFQFPYFTNDVLFKIAPDGALIWELGLKGYETIQISFDIDNNPYVVGTYTNELRIYSSNDPIGVFVDASTQSYQKLVLIKFDSQGELQWFNRSTSSGSSLSPTTVPHAAVTDKSGNTYITGSNEAYWSQDIQVFFNTDGTTTTLDLGRYFIAKIDSSGICNWVNGADWSYYANGLGIALNPTEDEITTCGALAHNNIPLLEDIRFSSQGSYDAYLDMGRTDLFVARYDSAGVLLKLCRTGNNQTTGIRHTYTSGLFYGDQDTYYLGRIGLPIGNSNPYLFFGDSIIPNQLLNESVTRFSEDCATCICPGNNIYIHDTICENDNYTFTDGVSLNSITSSLDHIGTFPVGTNCLGQSITSLIVQPLNTSQNQIVCYGDDYTFADGSTVTNITSNFVHTSVVITPQGCPLNETININVPVFDLSLELNSNTISTSVYLADWQWLDCNNNYAIIPGETNQSFDATQNGLYAVKIEKYGCIDTSDCILIDFLNSSEIGTDAINVYPNPASTVLNIRGVDGVLELEIYDVSGTLVQSSKAIASTEELELDIRNLAQGMYNLILREDSGQVSYIKFIKSDE